MLERFIFWLKSNFGFSNKESRGFLLVVPMLVLVYAVPKIVQNYTEPKFEEYDVSEKLDSLLAAGWEVAESGPRFNPQDTLKTKTSAEPEGIKMIPFSEADSIVLQIVPGIGPALAGRIIKYQIALGGFHSTTQLIDVFGVSQEVADRVWEYFSFDPAVVRQLSVNKLDVPELAEHPYISYGQAKVLVAYRGQHGAFSNPEDFRKIKIFTEDWITRVTPYLSFQE